MDTPIRFQEFFFHSELGELIRKDESGRELKTRLAPQPSKLLLLLLDNYPNIVSQKQIKDALWPNVHVDYERSLHYCVRQIRAALNDNASNPRFIETIPRRGYRWKIPFEQGDALEASRQPILFTKRNALVSLIGLTLVLLYFFFPRSTENTSVPNISTNSFRIAIMPFQPQSENHDFADNDIALKLIDVLSNHYGSNYQIIGPTTTTSYHPERLRELINDFDIDYLLNGRYPKKDTKRVLAEVIRASDGAHVWVKYFDATADKNDLVEEIVDGLVAYTLHSNK